MNKFRIVLALVLAFTLLAVPGRALAAPLGGPVPDEVVFGDDFTLAAGDTLEGNLVVFGGNVSVEAGATVTDSLVVFGGNVDMAGTVEGNLVVIGGNLDLLSTAIVEKDLVNPGGNVNREAGSVVRGNLVTEFKFDFVRDINFGWVGIGFSGVWQLVQAVAMTAIALLLLFFAPDNVKRTSEAIARQPVTAGGLGLLTLILTPVALIVTLITCVLPPIILLIVVLGSLFGWVALGYELGRRLEEALKSDWSPLVQGTLGTFLLTLGAGFITWIPCVGWLAGVVLGAAGLGAVLITRFGTFKEPVLEASPVPNRRPAKRKGSKRTSTKRTSTKRRPRAR